MPITLKAEQITLNIEENQLLNGIDISVAPGETLCMLGGSGSGKSLLLRVLAGLLLPHSGSVYYNETDIYSCKEWKFLQLQRSTGFVFQDAALISNLSIYDNLALPLRYHYQMDEKMIRQRILESITDFSFDDKLSLRPAKLSIGNQKLISLVRALILNPELVFYDEPISNIDRLSASKVISQIYERKKINCNNSVIVTNDIDFASSIADKIVILESGRILLSGSADEVMHSSDPVIQYRLNKLQQDNAGVAQKPVSHG